MTTDYDNQLLKEGILCFKAGQFEAARRYFERALDIADDPPTRSGACYFLSQMTDDPQVKRDLLEETLAQDALHAEARRALAILDGRLKPADRIDPNTLPPSVSGNVQAISDRYTCPKCGGRMTYAADGRSLACEFCMRSESMGTALTEEQDFFAAMASRKGHSTAISDQVLRCQGCGAEYMLAVVEMSTVCAFCGSAHVLRAQRDITAPDSILPFAFDQNAAAGYLAAWAKKKKLPMDGASAPPRPLYLPVWAFNIVGTIPWNGQVANGKRHTAVSGEKPVLYGDIAVAATSRIPRLLPALLQGFNFSVTTPYDPRYLAGWPAEVPAISLSNAALEARRLAVLRIRASMQAEFGHVEDLHFQASAIAVDSFNLALVPVWLAEITTGGRSCALVINGVSGAVHADLPTSGLLSLLGGFFTGKASLRY